MTLSALPALLATCLDALASFLHKHSAARLRPLFLGLLFARGLRTVTSWLRAAGITDEFRSAYSTIWAIGRRCRSLALPVLTAAETCLPLPNDEPPAPAPGQTRDCQAASVPPEGSCLRLVFDDTPSRRYGPEIEGAGVHHNPNPGLAGERRFYGHLWVTMALIARHQSRGCVALPLRATPYIRRVDVENMAPDHKVPFQTKLQMAAEMLKWMRLWRGRHYQRIEAVVDGAFAKKSFLDAARGQQAVVYSRLRKDAALRSPPQPRQPGQRGPDATYGKERISLAGLADQAQGWQKVECVQYGQEVTKTIKTFQATWRPARGLVRVVLVKEEHGWLAFFCTDAEASAESILEAMADRNAIEQTFKDVKMVYKAEEQQVRNLEACKGCWHMNLWAYTLVEAWAWDKEDEELMDRSASPWDREPRRPSHADKRRALQKLLLREGIQELLQRPHNPDEIEERIDSLLNLAL